MQGFKFWQAERRTHLKYGARTCFNNPITLMLFMQIYTAEAMSS